MYDGNETRTDLPAYQPTDYPGAEWFLSGLCFGMFLVGLSWVIVSLTQIPTN
jgi:hypothetical protein